MPGASSRKILKKTVITVEYNQESKRDKKWAAKVNSELGQQGFELDYFGTGKAIYIKKEELPTK
jgi:DUF2075 family protein